MSELRDLQKAFFFAYKGDIDFDPHIKKSEISSKARFDIYRTNIREALRKTLENHFPLTWKLIGQECADGAAYTYIHKGNLPDSGNLDDWGGTFPLFLKEFEPVKTLGYLSDFAHLEWLKHLSSKAKDVPSLSAHDFQKIAPEDMGKLILTLHPSVQILSSHYPLDQVLDVVEGNVDSAQLDERGSVAFLHRPHYAVDIHWIPKGYELLFEKLSEGVTLGKAYEDSPTDLQEFLSFSFQNKVFSSYKIK